MTTYAGELSATRSVHAVCVCVCVFDAVPLTAALIALGALYAAAAFGVVCFVSIPRYLARRRAALGVENIIVEEIVRQPPPQQFYPEPPQPPFRRNYWV